MARIKVKITKTCVLGLEGNEVNILESQLPRFKGMFEPISEEEKTEVQTGNVNNMTSQEFADKVLDHEKENLEKTGADKIDENINLGSEGEKTEEKKGFFGFGKKK